MEVPTGLWSGQFFVVEDHLAKCRVSVPVPLGAKSQEHSVSQKSLYAFLDAPGEGVPLQTENFCKPERKKSAVHTVPALDTCKRHLTCLLPGRRALKISDS